ncbi:hypothetical protein HOY82DRAFT_624787 [Tuber indicum]|nr:hypothetical protein HOY82DRAFT_624787 [Tuber indicum]
MRAAKGIQCVRTSPLASLGPALTIKRELIVQLHHRLISSIRKDGEAAKSVDLNNQEIDVRGFMNITGLSRMGVDGSCLTAILLRKGVFVYSDGGQLVGNIPAEVNKRDINLMSIPTPKDWRMKGIGASYIHCRPKVSTDSLISGCGQKCGLHSATLARSLVSTAGEPYRISKEEIKYQRISKPFFSQNSIRSSIVHYDNDLDQRYHKQLKQFTRTFQTMYHDMGKSNPNATAEDSGVGIQETNPTGVPDTKAHKNTIKKKRDLQWGSPYSRLTRQEAESRLGIELTLPGTWVKSMLEHKTTSLGPETILKAKKIIYESLVRYIEAGGYPLSIAPDFNDMKINDIVAFTIYPLIALFNDVNKQKLHLSREKEIATFNSRSRRRDEYLVLDSIFCNDKKCVLVAESRGHLLGEARKQCFLSLKDMRDCNGGGTVYGFVTTGEDWRMISFDGTFKMSNQVHLLFETMGEEGEEWMEHYSILIDCFNVALSNAVKDLVQDV